MGKNEATLTVFFEDPYWIAMYERTGEGLLEVCRVIFGAEPGNAEIYRYFLDNYRTLSFSPPVAADPPIKICSNPKRMQRIVSRQIKNPGTDTRARQALRLQQEQNKRERSIRRRQRNEQEKTRLFELRREKKKQKHKGR